MISSLRELQNNMDTPTKIRPATLDDLDAILEIYNEAVLNTTASYDYEPWNKQQRREWFDDHAKNNYPVLVAERAGGKIVGWSSLGRFHSRMGYRFTAEDSVYIAPEHRGHGVGKQLLAPLIDAARERQFHSIIGLIDASNEASVRLHARFGFEKVAFLKQVGFKFGRWLDVVYMQLMLTSPPAP
jgi:phosphinothricin acetyltransferase